MVYLQSGSSINSAANNKAKKNGGGGDKKSFLGKTKRHFPWFFKCSILVTYIEKEGTSFKVIHGTMLCFFGLFSKEDDQS